MKTTVVLSSLFILVLVMLVNAQFSKPTKKERSDCDISNKRFYNDTRMPKGRNGLVDTYYRWPNAVACYIITGDFSNGELNTIRQALSTGYAGSCLQPKECRNCCNGDYIDIKNNEDGCWADAGRQGGRQELNLGENCVDSSTVLHEFLHSVGFMHEQSNPNRDDYVEIVEANIDPEQLFNFEKFSSDYVTDFGEPYDYCSIMHYDDCAFSMNGEKTIIPYEEPNCDMGWVEELSQTDMNKVNYMYNCN